ncbi:MAG TPA: molybdopterin cofactor-binding domain-containing protein, partial [Terriglobia bacterium]|nr:molybdopterin cofactor-binding domain-containing protein [Terriglobia bacterium]
MRRTRDLDAFFEPERYELDEASHYRFDLSRRHFLGVTGAGLLVLANHETTQAQTRSQRDSIAARLHISKDGQITLMTSKVEVGQGSRTQLAQAAAEELRVSVEQINLVMADTAQVPDDGGTAGSRTTASTVPAVRKGAAAAREVLIKLARQQWGVEGALKVEGGKVTDSAAGRTLSYADLAGLFDLSKSFEQVIPADVKLYLVDQWTVLGTSPQKANARNIVTGSHRYPSDVVRPNMLFGKVLRAPSYGAVLTDVDLSAAQKLPGVTVVRDGNFAGCAAATSFHAQKALEVLSSKASWKAASHPSSKELFTYLKQKAVTDDSSQRKPRVRSKGSLQEGLAAAKQTVRASYEIAYIQHAPMEPRAAVAEWQEGQLTVWTGTQQPQRVRRDLADAFHLPEDRVRVIVPDTGGGFGGKHTGEVAVEAARLSKGAGRPVSLRWTREEEFTWAYFRPAGLIETQAGLAADGHLLAWDFTNFNSGASALESPYEIPHTYERFCYSEPPLREGSYRALAATANTFARESFMDELAASAKTDALEYRLAHLKNERLRAVLQAAAERFGWQGARKNDHPGKGVGLACGTEKGSYTAACVEVAVDRERGAIKVLRIVEAFECGAIQNPENLRAQVEGCII